ncbi:hypothetical protein C8R43DRAFT_952056 [Mycena crocata]|nr:hypothetical protein C8R43DRAFT_952056 [Mycena crocata]
MSTPRTREKRVKKPPACDLYKATRRVLCHPQPCPRCVEKNAIEKAQCNYTPRSRETAERWFRLSSIGPDPSHPQHSILGRDLTARSKLWKSLLNLSHTALRAGILSKYINSVMLIEVLGFQFTPQYCHPLLERTSIRMDIRAVSFQLHLLPPQSCVLALCIISLASLTSFHRILGDGPRPESFMDQAYFSSSPNLLECDVRRTTSYRALRSAALKAAREIGIILQPSNENAVSCFLLDLMEQTDSCWVSRPWENAYVSHVRALAPMWHASGFNIHDASHWSGFLVWHVMPALNNFSERCLDGRGSRICKNQDADAAVRFLPSTEIEPMELISAQNFTNDQLLLTAPEPPSLEALLASLEASSNKPGLSLLWSSMKPYCFHVTSLARQLSDTIAEDYVRLNPLSEGAVINLLSLLPLLHAVLSLLLDRVDTVLIPVIDDGALLRWWEGSLMRICFSPLMWHGWRRMMVD